MMFTFGLLASTFSGIEWSRPLMIGWLVIALTFSFIEVWLLTDGFSSQRVPAKSSQEDRSTLVHQRGGAAAIACR